jgi:hypothetical protein
MLTLTIPTSLLSFQNTATSAQNVRDGSVTVTLRRAGATVRQVAEIALAKLGLSGDTLTKFNSWAKTDIVRDATNQLAGQGVANDIRNATGANVSIKIIIRASFIKWLQDFGLNFAQTPGGEFSGSGGNGSGSGANNNSSGVGDGNSTGIAKDSKAYKEVERQWKEVESTAAVFSTRLISDATVRDEYQTLIKAMSKEMMSNFEKGLVTEKEAARLANEARNVIMEAQRLKTSDFGSALAEWQKKSGKTLLDLQADKAERMFGKAFTELSETQQKQLWLSIVKSAGKDSHFWSQFAKWGGRAGKGFVVVTIAISVWNIAQAENKVDATLKEGSSIGGAFAGAAIGGWAGAACGPGAVICVPLGIFVGGIIGAYAGESLYEAGRDAVVSEAK